MKRNPDVIFAPEAETLRGHWQDVFAQPQPLHLDLGAGRGHFLTALAQQRPELNVLGVEVSTDAMAGRARRLQELKLPNARILIADLDHAERYFAENEAQAITINFCNPWPKKRHQKRRLTHPGKLRLYERFLLPDGLLRIKTDDVELYEATLDYLAASHFELLRTDEDLTPENDPYGIVTEYETRWRGEGIRIKFIEARNGKKNTSGMKRAGESENGMSTAP